MIKLLRTAFFASLTALLTFVSLPLPFLVLGPVHLPGAEEVAAWGILHLGTYHASGQLLALAIASTLLPPVGAFMSQFLYLLVGLAGLPVFAEGGGLGYLHGSGFVFLAAFPFGAWLGARLSKAGGIRVRWISLLASQALVVGLGTLAQVLHAGGGLDLEAWSGFFGPMLQTVPAGILVTLPFAILGALGDRLKAPLPRVEVGRVPKGSAATQPLPRLPAPRERLALPGPPPRKALEGPPPRISLPEGPQES